MSGAWAKRERSRRRESILSVLVFRNQLILSETCSTYDWCTYICMIIVLVINTKCTWSLKSIKSAPMRLWCITQNLLICTRSRILQNDPLKFNCLMNTTIEHYYSSNSEALKFLKALEYFVHSIEATASFDLNPNDSMNWICSGVSSRGVEALKWRLFLW